MGTGRIIVHVILDVSRLLLSSTLHVPFLTRYGRPLPGTRAESKVWHEDPAPSPRRGWFLRSPCRSPAAGEGAIGNSDPGKSGAYQIARSTTCAKSRSGRGSN